jgi:hypothetical protein
VNRAAVAISAASALRRAAASASSPQDSIPKARGGKGRRGVDIALDQAETEDQRAAGRGRGVERGQGESTASQRCRQARSYGPGFQRDRAKDANAWATVPLVP